MRMNACATALATGVPMAIHSDAPVTPLGPLHLKGKTESIAAWEVVAAHETRTRLEVEADRGLTPFVGRERELGRLEGLGYYVGPCVRVTARDREGLTLPLMSSGGSSIIATTASIVSPRWCGGMFVAIPTAMPAEPFTSRFGSRVGSTDGSLVEPS